MTPENERDTWKRRALEWRRAIAGHAKRYGQKVAECSAARDCVARMAEVVSWNWPDHALTPGNLRASLDWSQRVGVALSWRAMAPAAKRRELGPLTEIDILAEYRHRPTASRVAALLDGAQIRPRDLIEIAAADCARYERILEFDGYESQLSRSKKNDTGIWASKMIRWCGYVFNNIMACGYLDNNQSIRMANNCLVI